MVGDPQLRMLAEAHVPEMTSSGRTGRVLSSGDWGACSGISTSP